MMSGMAFVGSSWAGSAPGGSAPGSGGSGGSGMSTPSVGGSGGSGMSTPSVGGSPGIGVGESAGTGDGAVSSAAVGMPGDTRVAGIAEEGVFFASTSPMAFRRPAAALGAPGLTLAQARTLDSFHQCATRGAVIDQLRVDGSFTFEATNGADVNTIQNCMTRIGYRFDR